MPDPEKNAAGSITPGEGAADQKVVKGEEGKDKVPVSALIDERNKRQSLEAKLKQMETVFGDQISYDVSGNVMPRQASPAQNPQTQNWDDFHRQLDHLWETDPRKAMQSELTVAIQWYDRVNADIEDQMDALRAKAKDIDQYRGHIRQYLRRLPIDQRGKPGIVEAAYYLQKGQSIDTIIENERKTLLSRMQAGENVQGIGGGSGSVESGEPRRWTREEVAVAKIYNSTPEEYFKNAKG